MLSMAGFSSHEQQRKALGCAAELVAGRWRSD